MSLQEALARLDAATGDGGNWSIRRDDHRSFSGKVQEEDEQSGYSWENAAERQRAHDANRVFVIQWYPRTPNGFYMFAAPDMDGLIRVIDLMIAVGTESYGPIPERRVA